ncbi:hypothetical protein PMAYCL1PPCAC_08843, partial [Pristionchus mayeri]
LMLVAYLFLISFSSVVADHPPARYRIQLDSKPSSRWDHVIDDHLQYLPQVQEEAAKIIPPPIQSLVWKVAENLRYFFPSEYAQEIEGISARSGLALGEVVGLNVLYDISAYDRPRRLYQGCTSIVACDEKGRIWHGRNLDYMMGNLLKNTTIIADFYRGEKLVYTGTTFVLYVGLLTGQRPGAFTVSLNQRYSGSSIFNVLMGILTTFHNPVSFVIRETLEDEATFDRAVDRLSKTHLVAPCYIIVGGMKKFEGVVISRDRWAAADVQTLHEKRWFLVETNFDHWTEEGDGRRKEATRLLSKMGRHRLNAHSLFRVLSAPPVRNNLTIYSGVMSAAKPAVLGETTVIIKDEICKNN